MSPAERKASLLRATCHVIARRGVRGLRVDEVADRAGVSTTLLYHYFGSRAGLLAATMRFVSDRADEYTTAPPGLTGRERLRYELVGEFQDTDEVRDNSAVWNEFRASAVFEADLRAIARTATEHWNTAVADGITRGLADGGIRPGVDPHSTAERLTALVEGLSNRWLTGALTTAAAHDHVDAALAAECPPPAG